MSILFAVQNNNLELFRELLRYPDADINEQDFSGQTPLHLACQNNNVRFATTLLEEPNIDLYKMNNENESAFFTACLFHNTGVIKAMLELEKFDPRHEYFDGIFPLIHACNYGYVDIVKLLLEDGRIEPNGLFSQYSLFHSAGSNLQIVKMLIEDGRTDYNLCGRDGKTPIWFACFEGYIDVIKYMLENCDNLIIPTTHFCDEVNQLLAPYRSTVDPFVDWRIEDEDESETTS